MGNSESISNDLENIGNEIVNGVVDTGYKIADGGSMVINETTEGITDNIIIPIVKELDPGQVETIKQQTRKPIKPPKQPKPPKVNLRKHIIKPTNNLINTINQGFNNEIINPTNNIINVIDKGFNDTIIKGFQRDIVNGFQRDIFNGFQRDIINPINKINSASNIKTSNNNNKIIQSDPIDDTTTYIIIGGVLAVVFLLLNNKK